MKIVTTLSLGMATLLLNACALFSTVEIGHVPQNLPSSGMLLDDVVSLMGAPDVIGGSGQHLVLGWRRVEALSILGLFQSSNEKNYAAVFDNKGNLLSMSQHDNGKSLTIVGLHPPMPIR